MRAVAFGNKTAFRDTAEGAYVSRGDCPIIFFSFLWTLCDVYVVPEGKIPNVVLSVV